MRPAIVVHDYINMGRVISSLLLIQGWPVSKGRGGKRRHFSRKDSRLWNCDPKV